MQLLLLAVIVVVVVVFDFWKLVVRNVDAGNGW